MSAGAIEHYRDAVGLFPDPERLKALGNLFSPRVEQQATDGLAELRSVAERWRAERWASSGS